MLFLKCFRGLLKSYSQIASNRVRIHVCVCKYPSSLLNVIIRIRYYYGVDLVECVIAWKKGDAVAKQFTYIIYVSKWCVNWQKGLKL